MDNVITLAGKQIEVQAPTFKQLRTLLPAINRVATAMKLNRLSEPEMQDFAVVLAAGTGKSVEEIDDMPIKGIELPDAFATIIRVSGLEEAASGEAQLVGVAGTTSTPTSQPVSAGPGMTSTD
jgi:hypothetical protein